MPTGSVGKTASTAKALVVAGPHNPFDGRPFIEKTHEAFKARLSWGHFCAGLGRLGKRPAARPRFWVLPAVFRSFSYPEHAGKGDSKGEEGTDQGNLHHASPRCSARGKKKRTAARA